jgi:ureidoacrylate peracid hydrolase
MEKTVVDTLYQSKCALVVVDMQNDYCHVDGTYSRNGFTCFDMENILGSSIAAIEMCKSRKIPVIYVRMVWNSDAQGYPIDAGLIVDESRPFLRTQGLRRGTWGAEIMSGMPSPDFVVEKTRYSGFHNTSLEPLLRGLRVDTILLTGVITNVCVEATARDAFHRDFRIVVLSDCVSGFNRKLHDASLETLRIFGHVTTAAAHFGEKIETKAAEASVA